MQENKRIIEIDGVKLEVDLRNAKVIDQYKVGDSVKLLLKQYSNYESYPAVIVGFTEYKTKPSIELLYMKRDGAIEFHNFYAGDEGGEVRSEIAPFNRYECLFQKEDIVIKLDRAVSQAEEALRHAVQRKNAFVNNFAKVFEAETV